MLRNNFIPKTDGSQHEDQTQSGPTTVNADPMGPEYFEYKPGGDNSNAVNSLSSQAVNCITDLFLIRNYVPLASVRSCPLLLCHINITCWNSVCLDHVHTRGGFCLHKMFKPDWQPIALMSHLFSNILYFYRGLCSKLKRAVLLTDCQKWCSK